MAVYNLSRLAPLSRSRHQAHPRSLEFRLTMSLNLYVSVYASCALVQLQLPHQSQLNPILTPLPSPSRLHAVQPDFMQRIKSYLNARHKKSLPEPASSNLLPSQELHIVPAAKRDYCHSRPISPLMPMTARPPHQAYIHHRSQPSGPYRADTRLYPSQEVKSGCPAAAEKSKSPTVPQGSVAVGLDTPRDMIS
jgi:hypothetical protein